MLNNIKRIASWAAGAMLMIVTLTGCNASKNVLYMQNLTPEAVVNQIVAEPIRVQPGDEIMVYVSCSDPEVAARLSLMSANRKPEVRDYGVSSSSSAIMLPYTVNNYGCISMPEIGEVKVAGMTRMEIAKAIEERIIDAHLAKESSVAITVQFANLSFSTIGHQR